MPRAFQTTTYHTLADSRWIASFLHKILPEIGYFFAVLPLVFLGESAKM
jgi:hypothetical protein